ncbi:MAG: beta-galactosidase [Candidatus Pristimantibacillus lignocellulolyticus]|uniref:Beta-galactosidase n=1 Tax=Candidatus Pristimantibacillus lignocellulolyticus TaxID=2994561 RepID=A0A9J6ZE40_9BACL|nr:MAG: beta-galactosidase [Candidatus Pristimantibacillus lignocellulolyticus]
MCIFQVKNNQFCMDEKPIRLLSGAIHYFRVVPEYWSDRLTKLKACGFNTVETYVPWNFHEVQPGKFNFEGMADIESFIKLAGEIGLYVIVRPSPYICAEWEFGGLPAWLLSDRNMRLRCMHQPFLDKVDAYYDVLLPKLKPLLCTNGGPIIAMQIENEYGSYGNDTNYLIYLKDSMIKRGMDVLLFTSDGPEHHMLQGGMVPDVLETVNFGSRAVEAFDMLRQYQPNGPVMCMEFWNGWFDHWGEEHHTREASDVAESLDEMLSADGSVNFYMFHGGTNFGFTSGANGLERNQYEPTITSYDYDVPLNESGEPTEKYFAVRNVVSKYIELPELNLPKPIPKKNYGMISVEKGVSLFKQLEKLSVPHETTCPESMEFYGQNDGFILYETFISGPREERELVIQECHDRALVYLDDKFMGVVERWDESTKVSFAVPSSGARIRILVENMGRINYGPYIADRKGITEGVRHGNQYLYGWKVHPLPLDNIEQLTFNTSNKTQSDPTFYKALLTIEEEPADTFLNCEGWIKGVVYINGFNLGRYWNKGPQKTLYIPAPLLRKGNNEIIVFELHGTDRLELTFQDSPILG